MINSPFPKIERKTLAAEVYAHLKESILSGALPPGTHLLEVQIAEQMQVSRAPVREALRMLEADRLIEFQVNQGAYVRRLGKEEIWEIYTARSVMEGYTAQLAAERAAPKDLDRLKKALESTAQAAQAGDLQATIAADYEIHRLIWEISGHKLLYSILTHLDAQIRIFMAVQAPLFDSLAESVKGHQQIYDAIARGDGEAASRLIQKHIIDAGSLALGNFVETSSQETMKDPGDQEKRSIS